MLESSTLPLQSQHLSRGAVLSELVGFSLPLHYGDATAEHQAIRNGAGIADRSFLAKVEFSGNDAVDYLERMPSNEVGSLQPGQGCHSTLLTDRGKLVADFHLYKFEDRIRIDLDPTRKAPCIEPLEKFIIVDDVTVTDVSEQFGIIGVYGPKSAALLSSVFRLDMPPLTEYRHFEAFFAGEDFMVACRQFTGEDGYEIWAPVEFLEELFQGLLEAAPAHDGRLVGAEALNIARVEAGVPLFGYELNDNTIPNEAGLLYACSVTKGCYIGQEIISRIHHLGHVNRQLTGLKFNDRLPDEGDLIKDGERKTGTVTSVVQSPSFESGIALSILRTEHAEVGNKVSVESEGGVIEAEVVELPFYST